MISESKYFVIHLFTAIDFSDKSLLDFKVTRGADLTAKEYSSYLRTNKIGSERSRELIDFLIKFDDGAFLPERCDAYEPVKDKFTPEDISGPVRWLSQPGGAVFFRKTKKLKYQGKVENHRFAPVWQEGIFVKPKVHEPFFLGEILLYVEVGALKKKRFDYLYDFLLGLARSVRATYGFVTLDVDYLGRQKEVSEFQKRNKLPGIFWINYFGTDLISAFRKEALNQALPKTKKFLYDDRDLIFILSEDPKDSQYVNASDIISTLGKDFFS